LAQKGQVNCYCCNGEANKFGSFKNKNRIVQRYRCVRCAKTFSESQPLDGLRVDFKQASQVVHLLCEGMGIRAAARITNLHRDTVLSILETAGANFAAFLDSKVRDVKAENVQVDEIYTFVGCKKKTTMLGETERGDFFTYLSIDRASKLIINWHTSKRDGENTLIFMQDLKSRMAGRFQLTTDAFNAYWRGAAVVPAVFGTDIDYATETKMFGRSNKPFSRYYNPLVVVGIKRQRRIGNADLTMATTCHTERTNLSVRTFTRRFTRSTIGYSKTVENLRHAVAMFVCHFNFCRKHSAHGKTPAQVAGLVDKPLTIEEILNSTI
jgi:transposase-like protein/IS1 family transposase